MTHSVESVALDLGISDVHVDGAVHVKKSKTMSVLKAKKRNTLPDSAFALPSKRAYPIHDRAHAANAMARLEQNRSNLTPSEYASAKRRIESAERKFGIKAAIKRAPGKSKGLRMRIHPGGTIDVRHMNDGSTVCHSFQEILASSASAEGPVWIQIARSGKFEGHSAGYFEMNDQVFADIVRNFTEVDLGQVAFDFEHASEAPPTDGSIPEAGAPAQGWVKKLEVRAGSLWGLVDWLEPARTYIREKKYRFLSPAIRFGAKHPETGKPIGARLTSVALTNRPFLRGMLPIAASDGASVAAGQVTPTETVTMKYAYSSNEYMPRVRACLRLPEICSARECADAMDRLCEAYEMGGGAMHQGIDVPGYVAGMREMVAAPMTSTVEDIFDAVKALINAAIEEHEAEMHPGQDEGAEGAEMADKDPSGGAAVAASATDTATAAETTTMSDAKIKELEATNAVLLSEKSTIAAKEAALTTANAELSLKLTDATATVAKLEGEVKALSDWKAKREEDDLKAEVDTAFETYKDTKKLSDKDREHMLVLCKAAPESFRALYPKVEVGKRHLLRDITPKDPTAAGAGSAPVEKPADKPLTIVTLADKLRSDNPKLSLEDSLVAAEKQIRSARHSVASAR